MWIRRIIWIILIFFSLVLYIFVNSPATLSVFIALLIIPAVSFLLLKIASAGIELVHEMPKQASKGVDIESIIALRNKSLFPVSNARVSVEGRNIRTGDKKELCFDSGMIGKKESRHKYAFNSRHCGKIEITTKKIQIKDMLGMFMTQKELPGGGAVTVYPDRFFVNVSLTNSASALLEGDKYSRTRTGNDSSETMGIKEYVMGDPVKNMHWKLSAKTDKLLVKEYGQPIVDQVCLLLDMSVSGEKKAEEVDVIADVFVSITDAMIENGVEPDVGWQDPESGTLNIRQVRSEEELSPVLEEMMGMSVKQNGISISESAILNRDRLSFAHVVAVGVSPELDMTQISNGARATLILPETETIKYGQQRDGTGILTFNCKDYKKELNNIEI